MSGESRETAAPTTSVAAQTLSERACEQANYAGWTQSNRTEVLTGLAIPCPGIKDGSAPILEDRDPALFMQVLHGHDPIIANSPGKPPIARAPSTATPCGATGSALTAAVPGDGILDRPGPVEAIRPST